jgi:hypothetical protein
VTNPLHINHGSKKNTQEVAEIAPNIKGKALHVISISEGIHKQGSNLN